MNRIHLQNSDKSVKMHWIILTALVCAYGFFRDLRPSDAYLTKYLTSEWKNLTIAEVNNEIYPWWTYSYAVWLIPVFTLTDYFRYKPTLVMDGAVYIGTAVLLIWARGLPAMICMQVIYGLATAGEVGYYSYLYAMVEKQHYRKVAGLTRFSSLLGRFSAYLFGQFCVSYGILDLFQLNAFSLSSVSLAFSISVFLPRVRDLTVGQTENKSSNIVDVNMPANDDNKMTIETTMATEVNIDTSTEPNSSIFTGESDTDCFHDSVNEINKASNKALVVKSDFAEPNSNNENMYVANRIVCPSVTKETNVDCDLDTSGEMHVASVANDATEYIAAKEIKNEESVVETTETHYSKDTEGTDEEVPYQQIANDIEKANSDNLSEQGHVLSYPRYKPNNQSSHISKYTYRTSENLDDTTANDNESVIKAIIIFVKTLLHQLKETFTSRTVILWSVWWVLASVGNFQMGSYIQNLWEVILRDNHEDMASKNAYNGAVEAAGTLAGSLGVVLIGFLPFDWSVRGRSETLMASTCGIKAILLWIMARTNNVWVAYVFFDVLRLVYHVTITIETAEIAKALTCPRYSLVFGCNMFLALIVETVFTAVVVDKAGFGVDIRTQFVVYAVYSGVLAAAFGIVAIITIMSYCKSRGIQFNDLSNGITIEVNSSQSEEV